MYLNVSTIFSNCRGYVENKSEKKYLIISQFKLLFARYKDGKFNFIKYIEEQNGS